jgi:twinkle protein
MFKHKEACPKCGSQDNVAVWLDDDGITRKRCFTVGCDYSVGYGQGSGGLGLTAIYSPCALPQDAYHIAITGRGISLETSIFYDVKYSPSDTSLIFPYKRLGVAVGYKGRNVAVPKADPRHFYCKGKVSKLLFGMQTLKNKEQRNKRLVLTFGELDAMAAYQMLGIPAICAQNDQATIEAIRANLEEVESMDTVYIVPDADPSAMPLVQQVADLLEVEARVVSLRRFKDPNDYLMHGQVQAFRDEFYAAEVVPRTYLMRGDTILERGLAELKTNKLGVLVGSTPIDLGIGGIRLGDLSFILGSPFAGKSTFTHHLAWKCLSVGFKVLYVAAEERVGKAIAGIMRASSEDEIHSNESVDVILNKVGNLDNLLTFTDEEDMTPFSLDRRLRQVVRGEGVQVVFIDNLTAIAGGTEGQWKVMNEFILSTRRLTSTRPVSVFWVAHTGRGAQADAMESGYGTSFIEKISDNLLGAVRSKDVENGVKLEVLKCRALGRMSTYHGVYHPDTVDFTWQQAGAVENPNVQTIVQALERMM